MTLPTATRVTKTDTTIAPILIPLSFIINETKTCEKSCNRCYNDRSYNPRILHISKSRRKQQCCSHIFCYIHQPFSQFFFHKTKIRQRFDFSKCFTLFRFSYKSADTFIYDTEVVAFHLICQETSCDKRFRPVGDIHIFVKDFIRTFL